MSSDKASSLRAPAASPTPVLSPIVQLLPTGYRDIQPFQRGQGWHSNGKTAVKLRHAREASERVVFPVIPSYNGAVGGGDMTPAGPSARVVDERFEYSTRDESQDRLEREQEEGRVASPPTSAIPVPPPSRPRRPSSGSSTGEGNQRSSSSGSFRTRAIAASINSTSRDSVNLQHGSHVEQLREEEGVIPEPDPVTMERLWHEYTERTKHPTKTVDKESYHRKMQRRYNETKALRERIIRLEMELEDAQRERDEALEASERSVAQRRTRKDPGLGDSISGVLPEEDVASNSGVSPRHRHSEQRFAAIATRVSMSHKWHQHLQANPEETSYREKATKLERTIAGVKEASSQLQARLMGMHETDQATIESLRAQLQLEQRASKLLSVQLQETNAAFRSTVDELVSTQVALEKEQVEKQIVVEQIQADTRQLISDQRRKELQSRVKNVVRTLGKEALHQKMEALRARAMAAEHHMRVAQLEVVRLKQERDLQQQRIDEMLSCREIKYHCLASKDGGIPGILQRATTLYQGTRTVNGQFLLVHMLYEDERSPIGRYVGASSSHIDPPSEPADGFCIHIQVYDAFTAQDDYITFHLRDIQRLVPDAEKYLARYADRKKERFLDLAELLFAQCHLGYKNGHIVLTERPSNQLDLAEHERREVVIYRASRFVRSTASCGKENSEELLVDLVINEVHNPSTSQLWWLEVQATALDCDSDQECESVLIIDGHVLKSIVPIFASYRPSDNIPHSDELELPNAYGIHEDLLEPLLKRFEWRRSDHANGKDGSGLLLLDKDGAVILCGGSTAKSATKSDEDEKASQQDDGAVESLTNASTESYTAHAASTARVLDHRSIVTIGETFFCVRIEEVWDGELMLRVTMEEPDDAMHRYEAVLPEDEVAAIVAHLNKMGLCDTDHSSSIKFGLPPSLHDPLCRLLKKHANPVRTPVSQTPGPQRALTTQPILFETLIRDVRPPGVLRLELDESAQILNFSEAVILGRRRIIQVTIVGETIDEQLGRELLLRAFSDTGKALLYTQRIGYHSKTTSTFGIAGACFGFAPPLEDAVVIELWPIKSAHSTPPLPTILETQIVLSRHPFQRTLQVLGLRTSLSPIE